MNIGIFLKQFKRSNQSIMEDIRSGKSELYGPEPLRELLKLLPESDEVKKLKLFRGDVSKLSLADSFVYLLIQLPSYVVRIEAMLLKEEFPAECESMKHDVGTLRAAVRELMCCEELHAVLHLVLQAGNILNAGGYAGNAVGFKLSSLPSLAETRANKPGMNLLHFVALEAQKKDEKLLEFPVKLGHVQAASRISLDTLDSELQRLVSRTRSIEESVQRDTELLQQLDTFLQSATSALCSLRGSWQQLKTEAEELLDFFCEDKDTFKLDDCFGIFNSFCLKFTAAAKDNAECERKEAARRRRLQELDEQKRHSWAAGEQFGGAFGFRSSSELDVHSAHSRNDEAALLMDLLMPKSHQRSPLLRRSGSFRRTRTSAESDVRESESKCAEKKDNSASLRVANEQTSSQNAFNVATNYLRNIKRRAETAHPTSDLNNNDGKGACDDRTSSKDELKSDVSCETAEKGSCNAGNMSVKVEKCTLVPELKAFEKASAPTKSKTQRDVTVTDFDEEKLKKSRERVEPSVKTDKEIGDTVIVWCVTGVCEVADAASDDQNVLAGNLSNHTPSKRQSANQNAVPISSQPQPLTRFVDIATEAKDMEVEAGRSRLTYENETVKGECSDQATETESKVFEIQDRGSQEVGISTDNQNVELFADEEQESQGDALNEEGPVQESDDNVSETVETPKSQSEELEKQAVNEQKQSVKKCKDLKTSQSAKSSVNAKTESSSKKAPSSKASPESKSIRTLTTTERHDMRRVVPISRPSSAKVLKKLPVSQSGISSPSLPGSSASRRLERPSTAPSSRRSSFNKADNQDQEPSKKRRLRERKRVENRSRKRRSVSQL
uniref:FH2 domain-containing protein n=1 Tax=Neogobius melanostomus TaxID=47308 RepID=A0A8C6TIY5_9GOBI